MFKLRNPRQSLSIPEPLHLTNLSPNPVYKSKTQHPLFPPQSNDGVHGLADVLDDADLDREAPGGGPHGHRLVGRGLAGAVDERHNEHLVEHDDDDDDDPEADDAGHVRRRLRGRRDDQDRRERRLGARAARPQYQGVAGSRRGDREGGEFTGDACLTFFFSGEVLCM